MFIHQRKLSETLISLHWNSIPWKLMFCSINTCNKIRTLIWKLHSKIWSIRWCISYELRWYNFKVIACWKRLIIAFNYFSTKRNQCYFIMLLSFSTDNFFSSYMMNPSVDLEVYDWANSVPEWKIYFPRAKMQKYIFQHQTGNVA